MSKICGRRVRELRDQRNWTQEDLAHKMGLSRNQINRIETGKGGTKLSTLNRLAEVFSVLDWQLLDFPALPFSGAFPSGEMVPIPIVEQIIPQEPYVTSENTVGYSLVAAEEVAGAEHFFLRVQDDGLICGRIQEGDLVLVRRQDDVNDGDMAVVLMNQELAIRRVYREKGDKWLLQAENPRVRPVVVHRHDVTIIGKAVKIELLL